MKVELKNIGKKYEGREEFTIRHINLDIESKDFCIISVSYTHLTLPTNREV